MYFSSHLFHLICFFLFLFLFEIKIQINETTFSDRYDFMKIGSSQRWSASAQPIWLGWKPPKSYFFINIAPFLIILCLLDRQLICILHIWPAISNSSFLILQFPIFRFLIIPITYSNGAICSGFLDIEF